MRAPTVQVQDVPRFHERLYSRHACTVNGHVAVLALGDGNAQLLEASAHVEIEHCRRGAASSTTPTQREDRETV